MLIREVTVYNDGSCPRCRLEIKPYRWQSGAEHIRDDFPREKAMRRLTARLPDAELRSGATLVCAIVDARRFAMACA